MPTRRYVSSSPPIRSPDADTPLRRHVHPGRKFPKIGKDPVGKTERLGELEFFLQWITDGPDSVVCGLVDPPFEAGPGGGGQDRIIAPVQNLAWISSKSIEGSQMGDL